ncbi:MAG TPA: hypothetical protein VEU72_03435 [Nitrosopumilaceae archaeon]|nr:hypothetical protein [Nitrosopumilaceae archaeon]
MDTSTERFKGQTKSRPRKLIMDCLRTGPKQRKEIYEFIIKQSDLEKYHISSLKKQLSKMQALGWIDRKVTKGKPYGTYSIVKGSELEMEMDALAFRTFVLSNILQNESVVARDIYKANIRTKHSLDEDYVKMILEQIGLYVLFTILQLTTSKNSLSYRLPGYFKQDMIFVNNALSLGDHPSTIQLFRFWITQLAYFDVNGKPRKIPSKEPDQQFIQDAIKRIIKTCEQLFPETMKVMKDGKDFAYKNTGGIRKRLSYDLSPGPLKEILESQRRLGRYDEKPT